MSKAITYLAVLAQLLGASVAAPRTGHGKHCDAAKLNTTVGSYTAGENTTMLDIAAATNRGACDIARYNLMTDPMLMTVDHVYYIPPQVCNPDSTTCYVAEANAESTKTCISGGPHVYTILRGDTAKYIAQKLDISVDALNSTAGGMLGAGQYDFDAVLTTGGTIKVPQCVGTTCTMTPYEITSPMVFYDLALKYGSTLGQLQAINGGYNVSDAEYTDSTFPVISLLGNCTSCSNCTSES